MPTFKTFRSKRLTLGLGHDAAPVVGHAVYLGEELQELAQAGHQQVTRVVVPHPACRHPQGVHQLAEEHLSRPRARRVLTGQGTQQPRQLMEQGRQLLVLRANAQQTVTQNQGVC